MTLICDLKTIPLVGYLKVILYAKFEDFGVIHFLVMLQTNRQTYRQTLTQTNALLSQLVGISNYICRV